MIIFKLQHRKTYHFADKFSRTTAISSSQKLLKIDSYTLITQLGEPALKHTRLFVTIVTIFPGSIFSHCRENCLWRLEVWQRRGPVLLCCWQSFPHPVTTHPGTMKRCLGFLLQLQFREKVMRTAHPNSQYAQQWHNRQLWAKWHPQLHQNLSNCTGFRRGDLHTKGSRKE